MNFRELLLEFVPLGSQVGIVNEMMQGAQTVAIVERCGTKLQEYLIVAGNDISILLKNTNDTLFDFGFLNTTFLFRRLQVSKVNQKTHAK